MQALAWLLAATLPGLAFRIQATDEVPEATRTRAGLAAFRAYLKKEYPDRKWLTGPSPLDSAAVRAAYGKQRFCFVFSRPPLDAWTRIERIEDLYRRYEAFQKTHLSLTARVNEKGRVVPLRDPEDYNVGLKKVASDADAKIAAAAILSLYGRQLAAPELVSPEEVTVTKTVGGWSCVVRRFQGFRGTVTFDAGGRCTAISKVFYPVPSFR